MSELLKHKPELVEPSLYYSPPYERPLEDEFAWHLVRYLEPISGLDYQVRVETPVANVWVDFMVTQSGKRFGFEITGLGEEETKETRYRDALVIGSAGPLDVLYRFRGSDLMHHLHDCLLIASMWDRDLFSARGRINLGTLANPEARTVRPRPQDAACRVAYPEHHEAGEGEFCYPGPDVPTETIVKRLCKSQPNQWLRAYDEALVHYGVAL